MGRLHSASRGTRIRFTRISFENSSHLTLHCDVMSIAV